jgi:penicillin amidase
LGESQHGLTDAQALQADCYSIPAERLRRLVGSLAPRDSDARKALDMLSAWNAVMAEDSAAAALFELWWLKHLRPAVIAELCPALGINADLVGVGDVDAILERLEESAPRFALLFERTLAAALREATMLLGNDPAKWRWGQIHQALFTHPLGRLEEIAPGFDVGPFPLGGDSSTLMHAAPRFLDRRVTHGASVRLIMDVGDWDRSLCINTPGQSGVPDSKFYGNLAPLWARGSYIPLLFSKSAVEAATETVLELEPAP